MEATGTLVYVRADGVTLDLNDGVSIKLRHHEGFGMPDFQHATISSPGLSGDYWFGVRYPARIVTIDVTLFAAGLAALQNLRRQVIDVLNPSVYTGTLKLVQVNGVERWFDCVLAESLPMPTNQHVGQRAMMLTLRFRSVREPFLYDPVPKQYLVAAGAASASTAFMMGGFRFPFHLSQSGVFNALVLTYQGQVPTPVEIVLTGPGIEPILRNDTLGRSVSFVGSGLTLVAGGTLDVDMDPRDRDVLVYGGNGWPYLRESGFWWLQPGPNSLSFEVSGSAPATQLVMTWRDRYLGV
jgi:hypothetical protein